MTTQATTPERTVLPRIDGDAARHLFDRRVEKPEMAASVHESVRTILDAVEAGGDEAVRRLTREFDGVDVPVAAVSGVDVKRAYEAVTPDFLDALRRSIRAVELFHQEQIPVQTAVETNAGVRVWREWRPVRRVGLYVPGGGPSYPSTVVMLGVPAGLAGCTEQVLVSPPTCGGEIAPPTLVAAHELGITEVYRVGGAQAIAALAFGTESVRPVDKIFGPGNVYVTVAKQQVCGRVAIDMPAGPSELVIVADESARPSWIAADLLANAEHGSQSPAVLISTSSDLIGRVNRHLVAQLETLPRASVAAEALAGRSGAILVADLDQAVDLVNEVAPEHLEIVTEQPTAFLERVQNAGSVFLGAWSPNAAGDYGTGTNHVLPTAGFARSVGALSVEAFGKMMEVQQMDAGGIERITPTVATLARTEGFEGHARAIEIRGVAIDDD